MFVTLNGEFIKLSLKSLISDLGLLSVFA